MLINCLSYNLRFWSENRGYELLYNNSHVISVPIGTEVNGFRPLEEFGHSYFYNTFYLQNLISVSDMKLLDEYFYDRKN